MRKPQKKPLRQRANTRQLMGISQLTDHGAITAGGELAFFLVRPDNLSVLSSEGIRGRITALTNMLRGTREVRILALDSRESFQSNKDWYRQRLEQETVPAIRELLCQDAGHLDEIQAATASAREFALVYRLDPREHGAETNRLRQTEQSLRDLGFQVQLATRQDIKRLLAVYYQQDVTTEWFEDYDGERWAADAKNPPAKGSGTTGRTDPPSSPVKDFLDLIAPAAVMFNTDHYICGSMYHCTIALRSYPPATEELALLRHLGEKSGVTLSIYVRQVSASEEERIIHNAENKNRMDRGAVNSMKRSVTAEANLRDVAEMIHSMQKNREPLIHCAVFLDLAARDLDSLRMLRNEVKAELVRNKLGADLLFLRQREGFLTANPMGRNVFAAQYERVLPAGSVANLYPFSYSGKTDPLGFYIGRDRYGSNIIVDLDRRAPDKTNANVLILGNSGQGKSYLLKLLLCNILEGGKSVLCLDAEHELDSLCGALDGCFIDLMSGQYRINPLEPRRWDDGSEPDDLEAPPAFRGSLLSQHISFLRDIFRVYKGFDTPHIDALELIVEQLYQRWGISDETNFQRLRPTDYPVLSDLYDTIDENYQNYKGEGALYPRDMLRDLLLGLHSMCKGTDARFFNGHTNISSSRFQVFCVKGLDNVAQNLRDTLLFSVLSYMSDQLLAAGNTAAAIDELYLWLSNPTAVTYIRNCLKRVRKKESALILASQNLEDFDQPGIRELTRPLFAIPTHQFLFYAGSVDRRFYMDNLQLEPSEFELIRDPHNGVCLFRCGRERNLLEVHAPAYKQDKFGSAGGR